MTNKKQSQQTKAEGDKNYLERKCERIDKEIDQLVYQPACAKPLWHRQALLLNEI